MSNNLFRFTWSVFFLVNIIQIESSPEIVGRCPANHLVKTLCRGQVDQCSADIDCNGESLCCSTGCNKICMIPSFTACDHSKYFFESQIKILKAQDAKIIHIPKCTESGRFEEIQCNENTGSCWCVDSFGFEKGGTRVYSRKILNCTRRNERCSGPQCRMLCPYGFELDDEGCEICICKDICKGVKCAGSLECQLQEVSCTTEPCPPVPTCKKPRTLENLCPNGVPFTIPENGNPYLCGTTPGKPSCPSGFKCHVNTGDDYGICCGSDSFYEKPGLCQVVSTSSECDDSSNEFHCTSSCRHDLECPEMKKCCMTESRGKQCTDALNSTLCLQQKKIAEILSTKEIEGRGYIPQCNLNGDFLTKQCSRNGKICWCVNENGSNIPQSFSLAEFVNCTNISRRRNLVYGYTANDATCDINICANANTCEFGFQTNEVTGCGTCDCNEDPCARLKCPEGSKCSFAEVTSCHGTDMSCQIEPTCQPNVLHVNPCDSGSPLVDHSSNQLVVCSENGSTCPSSHVCVKASVNTDGLCCLNLPRLEPTKPGMCPFISSTLCNVNETLRLDNKECASDKECEGDMKCCALPCGAICADPLLEAQTESNKLPTMCQYLQSVEMKQHEVLRNFKIALNIPNCKSSGDFEEVQCNETWCFCVDEFGIEITSTRVSNMEKNLTSGFCLEKRRLPTCLDMTCRLGCDYGYQIKENCRICECVNPCDEKYSLCDDNQYCEMVDMDCKEGNCPAVPYCIPTTHVALPTLQELTKEGSVCPKGTPYFDSEFNETLTCRPRARMLQCPDDYFCHQMDDTHDFGKCCPILELAEESSVVGKEDSGAPFLNGGNILDDFSKSKKRILTECELSRERLLGMTLKNQRVTYIPRCRVTTGEWEPIQCIDEVNMCWCVNNLGKAITGSMTSGKPICNYRQSRGKVLEVQEKVDQPVCVEGSNVHVCNKSLCDHRMCMGYPDATCGIDPCGGCRVRFYDLNNNIVNCDAGLGKCQRKTQQIMNSLSWINQQKQNSNSGEEDDFPISSIEHIVDDVLQERVGRATGEGSYPFRTLGDLLAEVVEHSSIERFSEKVSNTFLGNEFPGDQFLAQSSRFTERIGNLGTSSFPTTAAAAAAQAFSNGVPMMIRKAACPQPSSNSILFRLTGRCVDSCNYDYECGHDARCCLVDCGYRCQKVTIEFQVPLVERKKEISSLESMLEEYTEEVMFLNPPTCRSTGEFEPQQSQGDLMWCVDIEGNPSMESFTRGFVSCSLQGKMIEKRSIGNICPNSANAPMVCTDQCIKNSCAAHPSAICLTNPCDHCTVSFFSTTGEKLFCEDKCHQEVNPGLCRASFERYFYNNTSSQCEEFTWGGCQGNDNNFESLDECKNTCQVEVDICSLPVKEVDCDKPDERWYFDSETDSCQNFTGCRMDGNNFYSKEQCESRCPIRVLCPNIIDDGLVVCNRAEACRNINCGGLKTDEYICEVEPCSCIPLLKYLNGTDIHCESMVSMEASDSKRTSQIIQKTTTDFAYLAEKSYEIAENLPFWEESKNYEDLTQINTAGQSRSSEDILILKPGFLETKTRCLSMKDKYFSKCDDKGYFVPTQCSVDEPVCWCVDSAGNQVEGTVTFLAGSRSCPEVIIEKVDVRLSFPITSENDVNRAQLGIDIQDLLLQTLNATLEDGNINVEGVEGFMHVDFCLLGKSSVHVSNILEECLKRNVLGISILNQFTPADLSTSRFHYVVPSRRTEDEVTTMTEGEKDNSTVDTELNANSIVGSRDDSGVTAQEVNRIEEDLNIMAVVLTIIAAITAVLIIIGLFLGLQHKKVVENYPKHKFESLPFHSPFAFERKGIQK